jgi:hypothetical protein
MADKWVQRWYESSDSNPEKVYTVAIDAEGNWGCSCPAWTRNRGRLKNGECKHIRRCRVKVMANEIISASNAMPTPQPKATVVSSADLQDKWTAPPKKQKSPARQPTTRAMFLEL